MIEKIKQTVYYMKCDKCGYESQDTYLDEEVCSDVYIDNGWIVEDDGTCICPECVEDETN